MSKKRKSSDDTNYEETISLQDVIQEDLEMEETAAAVLGACDDQECTYQYGYVKRQALYACYTCKNSQDLPAGVCLACSLECHNGHDLYELYTKRNFCCDCGNSRFPDLTCKLIPEKGPSNEKNIYGHNFKGLYCTCNRPYPDEEDDVEDEMIQCTVCEDWFHGRHLGEVSVPSGMAFSEMICFDCTKKCSFLHKYSAIIINSVNVEKCEDEDVNVTDSSTSFKEEEKEENATNDELIKVEVVKNGSTGDAPTACSSSTSQDFCKVEGAIPVKIIGATFWPIGWRSILCKCQTCLSLYNQLKVAFLLEESDTVKAYEDEGKVKSLGMKQSQAENALKGMSRMHQVEMIHGFNDMKEGLSQYLKKFADEGKVVTPADIQHFFSGLNNKRQKLDMAYNCR